ncbi:MAG: phage baseplate assembly protein V [Anaerolineae bacterium]
MSPLTTTPRVTLFADGTALPADETRALNAVHVQARLSVPALCELVFSDPPGPVDVSDRLQPGARLRVAVDGAGVPLFSGEVTAVEYAYGPSRQREVRVRAYDLLHRLRKRQSVRAFVQVTVSELAQELGAEVGLRVRAAAAGPMRRRLVQHRRSDLDLLADMAAEAGLYLVLREETLHLVTLAGMAEEAVPLVLGESLLEARVELNGEPACRAVRFAGWDPLRVEPYEGRASSARIGREVGAEVPPSRLGGNGERNHVGQHLEDNGHAQMAAQAELDRRVAYEVALWGVAEGNPRLRPGTPVAVQGVDERLAGRYVLTEVRHAIDHRKGFVSELSTLPPVLSGQGERAGASEHALGIVTAVSDPERLGRVRVSLPGYGDVETEWMHVVSAGAGRNKGMVVLPDVGDRVLVLLPHGEPGAGVVMGGLYGMGGPADSGVEGGRTRRYTLQTPGGQRVVLDDGRQAIRLEDSSGNVVELTPEVVRIHAATDLELEAPGRKVVIRGDQIDFQRG